MANLFRCGNQNSNLNKKIYCTMQIKDNSSTGMSWQDRILTVYDADTNQVIFTQTFSRQAWNVAVTHTTDEITIK